MKATYTQTRQVFSQIQKLFPIMSLCVVNVFVYLPLWASVVSFAGACYGMQVCV